MAISAEFTVNGNANPAAHAAEYESVVTLSLTSPTGVSGVTFSIVGSSKSGESTPTLTQGGVPIGATAEFTMPTDPSDGLGRSYLIKCSVFNAYETAESYAVVGALNALSRLPLSAGEEIVRNATHGWVEEFNVSLAGTAAASSISATQLDANAAGYASMAALRAVLETLPVGRSVRTQSYSTKGDNGGGDWEVVAIGSYVHNGGTVITAASSPTKAAARVFEGAVHAAWFGARVGFSFDSTAAIQAAINTGIRVYAPGQYMTSAQLNAVAGGGLFGDGPESIIRLEGATTDHVLAGASIDGFYLSDITLDGDNASKSATSLCLSMSACENWEIPRLWIKDAMTWGIGLYSATDNRFGDVFVSGCGSSGIIVSGSSDNEIGRITVRDCGAFGVHLTESSDNKIGDVIAIDTGLEALGANYACLRNKIGSVVGRNNGDNCVSITGSQNEIGTIYADSPALNGLAFYGSRNVVGTLFARNVGQAGGTRSVIRCSPEFGGQASYNVVGAVQAIDDQTVATTANVIRSITDGHTAWVTATVVSAYSFRKNAGKIYRTAAGGTTGASAPVHTSGTVSDGGVSWMFIAVASDATANVVQSCSATSNITEPVYSGMPAGNWFAIGPGAIYSDHVWAMDAALRRDATVWATSQAVVWGDVRSNGGRVYVCSNVGGTTANAPTHSSGTTTGADSIAWTWIENGAALSALSLDASGPRAHSSLRLRAGNNTTVSRTVYCGSGSPANVVTASPGSIYLRSDPIPGDEFFVKRASDGTTAGWSAVLFRRSGNTGSRPTVGSTEIGFVWFDTTLGIPIWWSGTNWVNSSGATV